jgi:hypothetical protein
LTICDHLLKSCSEQQKIAKQDFPLKFLKLRMFEG